MTDIVGSIVHKFGPVQGMVVLGGEIIAYPNGIPSEETQLEWKTEYQAHLDAVAYKGLRKAEYDKLNQYEMQFDDQRDGTTTWVDAINAIKAAHPKP